VLLGDVVELAEQRPRLALARAEPVLRAIGERCAGKDIVLVPGNHDAALVRPWARTVGPALALDTAVPLDATPVLARVTSWLAPARVHVHYPGIWLSPRVWATHGHYLDRHLLPESAFGMARGMLGRLPRDGATVAEYEQAGPSITRLEAGLLGRLPGPLARRVEGVAERTRASTMPRLQRRLLRKGAAPLTGRLLGLQMRRAAIPALARVVHRLGVDADWVVFGHVHRCGPLPDDIAEQWQGPGGRPRIANTGAWVFETGLLHGAGPAHPYWPGGAILVEDDADPRALRLLDHVEAEILRGDS
jgi:hypothetical protein